MFYSYLVHLNFAIETFLLKMQIHLALLRMEEEWVEVLPWHSQAPILNIIRHL